MDPFGWRIGTAGGRIDLTVKVPSDSSVGLAGRLSESITRDAAHATAHHFFDEEGTRYGIYDGIRETYDGPLSMATDMMVWNLTRDAVQERMAVFTDEAWDVPGTEEGLQPDPTRKPEITWPELINQRLDMTEVNKSWLDEYKKEHGLE